MKYWQVSFNGNSLERVKSEQVINWITNHYDMELVTSSNGVYPEKSIEFYSDFCGNTLFVISVEEDEKIDKA